jgi:excinuclease UvrABC nuclease subunit
MRVNLYRVTSHRKKHTGWHSIPMIDVHFTEDIIGEKGVYLLIKNREIVYVGVSINIGSRIKSHINDDDKDFDLVFTLIDDAMIMDIYTIESILINILVPKYNKRIPKLKHQLGDFSNKINKEDVKYLNKFFNNKTSQLSRFFKENKETFKFLSEL